jgi:hypothetical protein
MDAGIKKSGLVYLDGQHNSGTVAARAAMAARAAVDVSALIGAAKIRSIPMMDLFIDRTYQRELDESRAKKIADKLNPRILGEITVSDRGDGKFAIVDGQHRYHALCLLGHCKPGATVSCRVFTGMSLEEEAMTFAYLGGYGNTRRALNAFSLWKARVSGKEPAAIDIVTIARKRGLSVTPAKANNSISAVRAIESIYNHGNLAETLDTAKAWANGDKRNCDYFDGDVLKAISSFLREYDTVTPSVLAKRLGEITPDRLAVKIRNMRKSHEFSGALAACVIIREQYNSGLKKNRLPPPRGTVGRDDD